MMETKKIEVIQNIYDENERIAKNINDTFNKMNIFAVNVMGCPGAGKTTSLKQIIKRLGGLKPYVIEGDIESDIDTQTMKALGVETVQINTGGACHLDSPMIENALKGIELKEKGILFIENIGNLVCPAEFVIGEHIKMLISSVTEGSDKPYKYPLAFEKADIILLNKCDLKQYLDFDDKFFYDGVKALNKKVAVFEVSGSTGQGFDEVAKWLIEKAK